MMQLIIMTTERVISLCDQRVNVWRLENRKILIPHKFAIMLKIHSGGAVVLVCSHLHRYI